MSIVRPFLPAAALALVLTACGGTGSPSGTSTKDALYFSSTNVPVAYLNESYSADLQVAGGVGPYSLRLASGKLPDGLTLSGTTLTGRATRAGLYTFAVEASDASLSTKAQSINLTVSALPPLSLAFILPPGEIRGETRLPLTITAPRAMRAFRLQWPLPAGVTVTQVTPVDSRGVAYWKVTNGTLTLDMGFRAGVATGDRLALVSVKPSRPMTLQSPTLGYNVLGADGKSIQQVALPKPPVPPAPAQTQPLPKPATAPLPTPVTTDPKAPLSTPATTPTTPPLVPGSSTPAVTPAPVTPAPVTPAPGSGK
jgi:Putative Ig domain